jgi:hypothetical protein
VRVKDYRGETHDHRKGRETEERNRKEGGQKGERREKEREKERREE